MKKKNRERYRGGGGPGGGTPMENRTASARSNKKIARATAGRGVHGAPPGAKKNREHYRGGGHPHGMKKKSRALPRGGGGGGHPHGEQNSERKV